MLRALLASALCLAALPALARDNYALLIGANQYQNLDERWWLKGPANDVQLVASYLTTQAPAPFDPANVTLLSDGVPGATPPTLAAIRAAFADLTARVQPGDFVYLHFSGHGTQAPPMTPPPTQAALLMVVMLMRSLVFFLFLGGRPLIRLPAPSPRGGEGDVATVLFPM